MKPTKHRKRKRKFNKKWNRLFLALERFNARLKKYRREYIELARPVFDGMGMDATCRMADLFAEEMMRYEK